MRTINELVIHHSAGGEGSIAQFRLEHKARGFKDIGYHAVVGNGTGMADGLVEMGRPDAEVGAGVWGNNTGKLHICLVGNFASQDAGYTGPAHRLQLRALGNWLLVKGRRYGIPSLRIVGHREITRPGHATQCPGDLPLAQIRRWYHQRLLGITSEGLDEFLGHKPSSSVSLQHARPGNVKEIVPVHVHAKDGTVREVEGVVENGLVHVALGELGMLLGLKVDGDLTGLHLRF